MMNTTIRAIRKFSTRVTTYNQVEIEFFKKHSTEWWSENCKMWLLRDMNNLRVPFIQEGLTSTKTSNSIEIITKPLNGFKFLDVGCGGGYLSEALAKLGAEVTGIDGTKELIDVAKSHASLDSEIVPKLNYINVMIEDFAGEHLNHFDAVVSSEVIEHVANQKLFIKHCVQTIKPGGSVFLTTINSTLLAKIFYIYLAENILRKLPKGLHNSDKFISPEKVQSYLTEEGCKTKNVKGFYSDNKKWYWSSTTAINYALHAVKR